MISLTLITAWVWQLNERVTFLLRWDKLPISMENKYHEERIKWEWLYISEMATFFSRSLCDNKLLCRKPTTNPTTPTMLSSIRSKCEWLLCIYRTSFWYQLIHCLPDFEVDSTLKYDVEFDCVVHFDLWYFLSQWSTLPFQPAQNLNKPE